MYMPVSVHKLLIRSFEIISKAIVLIGTHSERRTLIKNLKTHGQFSTIKRIRTDVDEDLLRTPLRQYLTQ